jgi:putative endonuclease
MLASGRSGTLYVGVISDLFLRVGLHKQDLIDGFTKRYGVHRLVYYEMHHTMPDAIRREKRLKKWNRAWKTRLIESMNPEWVDLFDEFWGAINEGLRISRGDTSAVTALICDPGPASAG